MQIDLAYGRSGASITVPDENLVAVVNPDWPAVLARPQAAVTEALRQPVSGPPLAAVLAEQIGDRSRLVGASDARRQWRNFRVVIAASDGTRPCPNREILLPLLGELHSAGIPGECITILIATGLHAPTAGPAARRLLGDPIVSDYRVVNHFGSRQVMLKALGATPAGTPVALAREWVEADVRIATGVIEPHLMAGFSGGRKSVCPGLAGDETVRAFHAPKFIEHPRALPGFLDGNPTHEEALAVADLAPPHFIVNVTVDRPSPAEAGLAMAGAGRAAPMTGVFAGDMRGAHAAGVEFLRQHIARPVPELCDILVTTNGGYPLDATYYQGQKGLLTGLPILKAGGTFLFAAACEAGLGQREFTDLVLRFHTLDEFMAAILTPGAPVIKDQWALQNLAKAARHARVLFWSDSLPRKLQERLFVTPVRSLEEGLAQAFEKHGPKARITVMPHGPYVLPYIQQK